MSTVGDNSMFSRVMLARARVYRVAPATPMTMVSLPGGSTLLVKREDLGPVHSFKWRGAAVRISELADEGCTEVVAASAGNHAQGVALASAAAGMRATIFMPRSTPRIKQQQVRRLGGTHVDVRLEGDCYDESAASAAQYATERGARIVHAYDDLSVIAGQGVIGDEIAQETSELDRVYLCVGGGGLAAGVATVLRASIPGVELIGVEAEGQASMKAALDAGEPVDIGPVDSFCDGTAVRKVGERTFEFCREALDRVVTVSNDEVCAAIELAWETLRAIPEPSGALAFAAAVREADGTSRDLAVLSGANLDFMTLPRIAQRSHIGRRERRYYAFGIREEAGSLVSLLDRLGDGCNIVDFQYGKTDERLADPVIGFEASPGELDRIPDEAMTLGIESRDVSSQQAVGFRVIPLRPGLMRSPVFAVVTFPDRGGALRELMHRVGKVASICYFNYVSTGETEGSAMMGFEFEDAARRAAFLDVLVTHGVKHRLMGPDEFRFRVAIDEDARPDEAYGVSR
ncbi:MAG: pyridoxal-phosphate dependent enzyme [Planctomycetota bacterium]